MSFQFTTDLDPIAVYAAIVATAALLLCLVQWHRSGARLTGHAIGNMRVHPDPSNRTYINLTVYNRGSRKTTVTGLAISAYRSWWASIIGRRSELFAIQRPLYVDLPLSIEAGHYFTAGIPQTDDLAHHSRDLRLYVELTYVDSDRPLRLRIKPIRETAETRSTGENISEDSRSIVPPRRSYMSMTSTRDGARTG